MHNPRRTPSDLPARPFDPTIAAVAVIAAAEAVVAASVGWDSE